MNERLQKLAEQANEAFSQQVGEHGSYYFNGFAEKFAELIVAECLKLNSKELSITAIERLLPLYKEHFGVEE